MQRPGKLSPVSPTAPPAFSGPKGWADLPDDLLHSIVARLGSFRDLLGFAAACPSWRAAYSSHPSKSMFRTKFPPLLILPHVRLKGSLLPSTGGCRELFACKVIDPANRNTALRCRLPEETFESTMFIGSSYGNLIYLCDRSCLVVDAFTGVDVSTPCLPSSAKWRKPYVKGTLTAPLASPNSHLIVGTESSLFDLRVGNDSWSELELPAVMSVPHQFVDFNGQFIVSDGLSRFYTLQLSPQFGLQEITTKFDDTIEHPPEGGILVVCGDMLLMHSYANKMYRSVLVYSVVSPLWLYPSMFYSDDH